MHLRHNGRIVTPREGNGDCGRELLLFRVADFHRPSRVIHEQVRGAQGFRRKRINLRVEGDGAGVILGCGRRFGSDSADSRARQCADDDERHTRNSKPLEPQHSSCRLEQSDNHQHHQDTEHDVENPRPPGCRCPHDPEAKEGDKGGEKRTAHEAPQQNYHDKRDSSCDESDDVHHSPPCLVFFGWALPSVFRLFRAFPTNPFPRDAKRFWNGLAVKASLKLAIADKRTGSPSSMPRWSSAAHAAWSSVLFSQLISAAKKASRAVNQRSSPG